jgi:hypothetical protein
MKTLSEVQNADRYTISLAKLLPDGVTIADAWGYVTSEFGRDNLVFQVSRIVLSDGTIIFLEAEHDMAYLGPTQLVSQDQMRLLHEDRS